MNLLGMRKRLLTKRFEFPDSVVTTQYILLNTSNEKAVALVRHQRGPKQLLSWGFSVSWQKELIQFLDKEENVREK